MSEMITNKTENPAPVPDVVDNIEFTCHELATEYINGLDDPDLIKDNNGLFVDMLKYIYREYVSIILNNNNGYNNRYDYKTIDILFNTYTQLVYKYKKNKQPNIVEFTVFINIDRQVLYNLKNGLIKKSSDIDIQNAKRWFSECENSLLNNDSVASIFKLKAMFNYNDNLAPIPIELQGPAMTAAELPDLSIAKIANNAGNDPKKDKRKQPKS